MSIVSEIADTRSVSLDQLQTLLTTTHQDTLEGLRVAAQQTAVAYYGHNIYVRGLIEISNICRNDCYYCGIRRSNRQAER